MRQDIFMFDFAKNGLVCGHLVLQVLTWGPLPNGGHILSTSAFITSQQANIYI